MDNRVGIDCGSRGWAGQARAMGENWDNCNRTIQKKRKNTGSICCLLVENLKNREV